MDNKTRKLMQTIEAALKETNADGCPRTVYNPGGGDEPFFAGTYDRAQDDQDDQFYCWITASDTVGLVDNSDDSLDVVTFGDKALEIVTQLWRYRR